MMDNNRMRRSFSTFFSWLEEEDFIIKSLMKRIHKLKTAVVYSHLIRPVWSDKVAILVYNTRWR